MNEASEANYLTSSLGGDKNRFGHNASLDSTNQSLWQEGREYSSVNEVATTKKRGKALFKQGKPMNASSALLGDYEPGSGAAMAIMNSNKGGKHLESVESTDSIESDYYQESSQRFGRTANQESSQGRLNLAKRHLQDHNDGEELATESVDLSSHYTNGIQRPIPTRSSRPSQTAKRTSSKQSAGWRLLKPGVDLLTKADQIEQRVLTNMRKKNNSTLSKFSSRSRSRERDATGPSTIIQANKARFMKGARSSLSQNHLSSEKSRFERSITIAKPVINRKASLGQRLASLQEKVHLRKI